MARKRHGRGMRAGGGLFVFHSGGGLIRVSLDTMRINQTSRNTFPDTAREFSSQLFSRGILLQIRRIYHVEHARRELIKRALFNTRIAARNRSRVSL